MSFFPLFKKKPFFTGAEQQRVLAAIRACETQTSGEIRVFVESRCRFVDPLDRAAEAFFKLKMEATKERNGVLVYVAMKDRQLAIFGDKGIHEKVGNDFWSANVKKMLEHFNDKDYAGGIEKIITEIGAALHAHFPYDKYNDINELPDDIVFGR
ncbi:MAG: TPM domain-containing protein [Bacteroidetes bacterium]|nr:TPM domain-containing protein [Bacteroidota bacterium]MBS1974163.1 TPM domain-containing protein [Bacteroidota bacterium]